MSDTTHSKISILGEEVEQIPIRLDIYKLKFLPDNPRVFSILNRIEHFTKLSLDEQQSNIFTELQNMTSVSNLKPEIERDGGLQEPILIRLDNMQVVEGNSRLAVYRLLNRTNPEDERWQTIPCNAVTTLTTEQQVRLFDQLHLQGKTDWTSYAKALYIHRWVHDLNRSPKEFEEISSFSVGEIEKAIKVIELMKENSDNEESRFSYYREALTKREIKGILAQDKYRGLLLSAIKNGRFGPKSESDFDKKEEGFTAMDFRDKLPVILKKPKFKKKLFNGEIGIDEAFQLSKDSHIKKTLNRVLEQLSNISIKEVEKLDFADVRAVDSVARKVDRQAKRLQKMVEKRVSETKYN